MVPLCVYGDIEVVISDLTMFCAEQIVRIVDNLLLGWDKVYIYGTSVCL